MKLLYTAFEKSAGVVALPFYEKLGWLELHSMTRGNICQSSNLSEHQTEELLNGKKLLIVDSMDRAIGYVINPSVKPLHASPLQFGSFEWHPNLASDYPLKKGETYLHLDETYATIKRPVVLDDTVIGSATVKNILDIAVGFSGVIQVDEETNKAMQDMIDRADSFSVRSQGITLKPKRDIDFDPMQAYRDERGVVSFSLEDELKKHKDDSPLQLSEEAKKAIREASIKPYLTSDSLDNLHLYNLNLASTYPAMYQVDIDGGYIEVTRAHPNFYSIVKFTDEVPTVFCKYCLCTLPNQPPVILYYHGPHSELPLDSIVFDEEDRIVDLIYVDNKQGRGMSTPSNWFEHGGKNVCVVQGILTIDGEVQQKDYAVNFGTFDVETKKVLYTVKVQRKDLR